MTDYILRPVVWAVGGSDCSSAAGIQTDLKTLTALGVHGVTLVTAVTAQNAVSCQAVLPLKEPIIGAQIAALKEALKPSAIKTGMLPDANAVEQIAVFLSDAKVPLICDPVLQTSSGTALSDSSVLSALRVHLFPRTTLLTPNIPEAEIILGKSLTDDAAIEEAGKSLRRLGCKAVLIKGGHGPDPNQSRDFYCDGDEQFWLHSQRQPHQVRGTGCAFASAVAASLAKGLPLTDAVVLAKAFVSRGIREAYQVGDAAPRFLSHNPWPVKSQDFPYWSRTGATLDQYSFPQPDSKAIGLYAIVDSFNWIKRLARPGLTTIQLRIKNRKGAALEKEIAESIAFCKAAGINLYINDHWQIACEHRAYGVHLGQEDLNDLSACDLTKLKASGMHLGISTHSLLEAARAHALRPSYVALGPILPTTCKSMHFKPQGFSRLTEWCSLLPYPVIAIGGLKVDHAAAVWQAGAAGAAVISDITSAASPEARLDEWLRAFQAAEQVKVYNKIRNAHC